MGWSLGGDRRGERNQPESESREQIDAREPRPAAVRLQQLRRLPRLDPPPAQRRAELDKPQVAFEPALEASEALDADDADRPRAEPTFALKARGRGIRRK